MHLTKWETGTITRKKWVYSNDNILTSDNKKVVPKGQLYEVLCLAHKRIAHRGRQITAKWINDNYSEVNQKIVNISVNLCRFHAEQKSITSRVKLVEKPLEAPTFLSLLEIDLIDFRNCACRCGSREHHTWVMNLIDHHTKYISIHPLKGKTGEEVLKVLGTYCYTYGYPKKILCDNGGEFRNHKMENFCTENGIKVVHGSPRTPTTQGLVERSNRTWKEDMCTLIISTAGKDVKHWCQYLNEVSYTRNITHHRAIRTTPYEAVYGMKPHREIISHFPENISGEDIDTVHVQDQLEQATSESHHQVEDLEESFDQRLRKRQKISENQQKYNQTMIKQTQTKLDSRKRFKVGDMVSVKIDKVDKTSPIHPNMLLGKITQFENAYARVVTQFGQINTLISATRLYPCTTTQVTLDYDKEISFSRACKMALLQNK